MIEKELTNEIANNIVKKYLSVLNEQVSRGVITQVVATGLHYVQQAVVSEELSKHIVSGEGDVPHETGDDDDKIDDIISSKGDSE